MARNIFLRFSACASSLLIMSLLPVLVSLVTPSTISAMSVPNSRAISSTVIPSQSSTTS